MTGNVRISLFRSNGWTRLGVAGAVAVLFGTPMLWALGVFGPDDQGLQRAMIFLFAGIWFFVAVGYTVGWAVGGFVYRVKEGGEEGGDSRPAASHPPAPPHPPAGRPPPRN